MGRREALFEIHNGYLRCTSIKFNCNTRVVRTCSCYFWLVMALTQDCAQLLDYTWARMRHYLISTMDTTMDICVTHIYVKFNLVRTNIKRNGLCMVCSIVVWLLFSLNGQAQNRPCTEGLFLAHTIYWIVVSLSWNEKQKNVAYVLHWSHNHCN